MALEDIFGKLCFWVVNFCLQSYTFASNLSIFLFLWSGSDPYPQSSWIRFGSSLDPDPVWIRIHNTGKQYLDISCNWKIKFCHLQYWWVVSVFLIRIRNPDKKDFLPYLVDRAASCRPTWWWDFSPCSTFPTHHTSLSLVSKKVFFFF